MIVNFSLEHGYNVLGLDFSPIKGGEGNIEFLIHLQNAGDVGEMAPDVSIDNTLNAAYTELNVKH